MPAGYGLSDGVLVQSSRNSIDRRPHGDSAHASPDLEAGGNDIPSSHAPCVPRFDHLALFAIQ